MPIESATRIDQLNSAYPIGTSDFVSVGDDHIRLIKTAVQGSFPNVTGVINSTHTEINALVGVSSNVQAQINTKLASSLLPNVADVVHTSNTELNHLVGVTANVQQQINDIVVTTGVQGIQGTQGTQGLQGRQGATGTGTQGVQGLQGLQGRQGVQGLGSQGVQGAIGSGSQGIQGVQGLLGIQGLTGSGSLTGSGGTGYLTSWSSSTALTGSSSATISGGNITAADFILSSDSRLKNIQGNITGALDIIKSLNGVRYTAKDDSRVQLGVIAQEVETVLPEAIHIQNDGYLSVSYERLIPVIVEALKELANGTSK